MGVIEKAEQYAKNAAVKFYNKWTNPQQPVDPRDAKEKLKTSEGFLGKGLAEIAAKLLKGQQHSVNTIDNQIFKK